VDLSANYLGWAERNLAANGFETAHGTWPPSAQSGAAGGGAQPASPLPHTLIQADCLRWIAEASGPYDLIWLDPPTFSNSKKMGRATLDVQRDHADLIRIITRRLLAPGGVLLFATNLRNFRLEHGELGGLDVKDISRSTLAFDCERSANRHHVYRIERSGGSR
jgi:23S rRNA (guanine2445-N2)-methyltransferase / 23S rRNA (guanine2069-N7)-methyltransferase